MYIRMVIVNTHVVISLFINLEKKSKNKSKKGCNYCWHKESSSIWCRTWSWCICSWNTWCCHHHGHYHHSKKLLHLQCFHFWKFSWKFCFFSCEERNREKWLGKDKDRWWMNIKCMSMWLYIVAIEDENK